MAIEVGNQPSKLTHNYNEDFLKIKGDLDDHTAKVTLAKFLRYNLSFTAQLILGIDMEPIQTMHMNALFLKNNCMLIWSRGGSKSTIAAWYCILKCIFEPGTRIVIASANFRTSRRIFEEIVRLLNTENAQLARACFDKKPYLRNDKFQWDVNGGYICAIPLSEDTRGMRCDVLILDELLLLSPMMINDVLSPFLSSPRDAAFRIKVRRLEDDLIKSGALHPNNRLIFENCAQMIGLSSASYTFQHLYKMFSDWSSFIDRPELIEKGTEEEERPTYFLSQLGWEGIPGTILNREFIQSQKASVSHDSFAREYGAQFRDGADGYFSMKKMNQCTIPDGEVPHTKVVGDPLKKYILSIDPSYSKCHGKGVEILMLDGSLKKVEDIIVGDMLMGPDNKPRKVLKTISGKDEIFNIQLQDSSSFTANKNHILCFEQCNNPVRGWIDGVKTEVSLGDYFNKSAEWKSKNKPYKTKISWPEKPLPIDPYFIGLWLGDGSKNNAAITTADVEIENYLEKLSKKFNLHTTKRTKPDNKAATIYLSKSPSEKTNPIVQILKQYNMFNNKYIPQDFLVNSEENQLKLLAGMLDSDGCKLSNSGMSFTNCNKKIIDGFMFITRSLGFRTFVTYYQSKNPKHASYWRVSIFGDMSRIPLLIEYKRGKSSSIKTSMRHGIKSIESLGIQEYYGFTIGGDQKYVLGDFTVTHNSASADYYAMAVMEIDEENDQFILVHGYQALEADLQDHVKYIYYIMTNFNVVLIAADAAHVDATIDAVNDNELFKSLNKKITYISEWNSTLEGQEYVDMLEKAKKQYSTDTGCMCIRQTPSSEWIMRANSYLQSCIDHKKIWFASRAANHPDYLSYMYNLSLPMNLIYPKGFSIQADSKEETRKLSVRDHIEKQDDIINDTKEQCANIEVTQTARGHQSFDLPKSARSSTSVNKPRKDNYSALVLGAWGVKCYNDLANTPMKLMNFNFVPVLI